MLLRLSLIGILASISSIRANYNGPFVLWGREELSHIKINSLSELDDKLLRDIYSDSSAIILFVRNASSHLTEENFPIFKDLLLKTNYVYLTQQHLGLDPMEFNLNAEVINLVGPTSQQDVELSALYRDAVITYGDGKVLGILATKTSEHEMRKRAIEPETPEAQTPPAPATTEPEPTNVNGYVFYPEKNIQTVLLYTSSPPRLNIGGNVTALNDSETQTTVTTNRRNSNEMGEQRVLKVLYNYRDKLWIQYIFNISGGSWTLVGADIGNDSLYLVGDSPSAPLAFSYKCSRPLTFRNENKTLYLELANIQVQLDADRKRFNDSFDCIGFTSAPIWSGIFVSFVICFAVALGLHCIMEIKPPNRFENSRGKQLTFTIQE